MVRGHRPKDAVLLPRSFKDRVQQPLDYRHFLEVSLFLSFYAKRFLSDMRESQFAVFFFVLSEKYVKLKLAMISSDRICKV